MIHQAHAYPENQAAKIETGICKAFILAVELFSGREVKINFGISIEVVNSIEKSANNILIMLE